MDFKSKLEDKKILITGGAGFIGSNLCEKLIELGANVVCCFVFHTKLHFYGFQPCFRAIYCAYGIHDGRIVANSKMEGKRLPQ